MGKKIMIDLDVLTWAFWDRNKEAEAFLDALSGWRYEKLRNDIKEFYNYNRKHLYHNKTQINEVLRRHGLNEISILLPGEV